MAYSHPNAHPLRVEDFQFTHHGRLRSRFDKTYAHLRVVDGAPPVETHDNVTYTPTRPPAEGEFGALYDDAGRRIPLSVVTAGRDQIAHSQEPDRIEPLPLPHDGKTYLYLGTFRPHFGHFITETLSRFWALKDFAARDVIPLVHVPRPEMLEWRYTQEFLALFGIAPKDLAMFDTPRKLGRVVIPAAALSLESHVFTGLKEGLGPMVEQALSATSGGSVRRSAQPVYFSRARLQKGVYRYHGEDRVEAMMRARGARIVYPEALSVAEQILLVNSHETLTGVIGSAMHNVMFSLQPLRMAYLTPRRVNPTCLLLDQCFEARSEYVQICSTSDILMGQWQRLRKRLPFPPHRPRNRFHFERNIDLRLVESWLATSDIFD